jgi:hypothetical protein
MTSFNLTENNEMLDVTSYGDTHSKFERGFQSWTASISGHIDLDDSQQQTLRTAARAGTKITDIRFYVDSTSYYYVDTLTDTEACCFISSFSVADEHTGVVSFDMQVTGSGPITDNSINS